MVVERVLVRSSRIAAGFVIAGIAYWVFEISFDSLGRPFASLSPLGLIGGLFAGLGGILLAVMAFGVAFGEKGESRIEAAWIKSDIRSIESQKRKRLGYDD